MRCFFFLAMMSCFIANFAIDSPALAGKGDVLAKVGNFEITKEILDNIIATIPEPERSQILLRDDRKKILDRVIAMMLLAEAAKADKIDQEPAVKTRLEFGQTLHLAEEYLRRKVEKLPPVTEQDAKAFYEANKKQFETPEEIKARHIVVRTEEEAKQILKKLQAGEDFAELSGKYSLDPTRLEGGLLKSPAGQEWLPRGTFEKSFETLLFKVGKGNLGGPVKTQFGWHILKVEDYRPAKPLSYMHVHGAIMNRLRNEKTDKVREQLVEEMKKKTPVEIK